MRVRVRPTFDGFLGELVLPVGEGGADIIVAGWASSIRGAVRRAGAVAQRITNDPMLRAMLPPGAGLAIEAAQKLARAADRGEPALRAAMREIKGPGAKRLAKVLQADVKKRPPAMRQSPVAPAYRDELDDGDELGELGEYGDE